MRSAQGMKQIEIEAKSDYSHKGKHNLHWLLNNVWSVRPMPVLWMSYFHHKARRTIMTMLYNSGWHTKLWSFCWHCFDLQSLDTWVYICNKRDQKGSHTGYIWIRPLENHSQYAARALGKVKIPCPRYNLKENYVDRFIRWQLPEQFCNRLRGSCDLKLWRGIHLERKGKETHYLIMLCLVTNGGSPQRESNLFPASTPW